MKKVFTFLVALGAITVAQAQSSRSYPDDRYHDKDVVLGQQNNRVYNDNSRYTYSFSERDRDKEIDRINRDYDKRINKIERDRRMSSYDKNYAIRRLDDQRREDLRQIGDRFRNPNNSYNNYRYQQNNR